MQRTTIWLCAALAFCRMTAAGAADSNLDTSGFLYYRFYPAAIYVNGLDATTLQVFTSTTNIKQVLLYWHWYDPDWQPLYDDATHGDRTAGDGVYTLDNLKAKFSSDFYTFFNSHHNNYGLHIKIISTTGEEKIHVAQLGLVDPATVYPAAGLGENCFATRSAFFVVDFIGEILPGYPVSHIDCGHSTFPSPYKKLYDRFCGV